MTERCASADGFTPQARRLTGELLGRTPLPTANRPWPKARGDCKFPSYIFEHKALGCEDCNEHRSLDQFSNSWSSGIPKLAACRKTFLASFQCPNSRDD